MIKVIKNGTVVTMDSKRKEQYEKLDIIIENNKIKKLVKNYTGTYDEIIDASEKIVMPGLINSHTHLGMSIFRGTNDNLELNDWLTKKIWPIEDKLTEEDTYYTTLLSCIEMIKTGTTTCNDMYFNCNGSIKAIKEAQIRCVFSRCLMDNDNQGSLRIEEFKQLYEEYKKEELITFTVAPHAFYTCSKEYLKKCSNLALKLNLPIHIHFCETEDEVKGIEETYQKDPISALEEVGMLNNKLILAHATFVDKNLDKLKGKDISFVHNPISNLNLGCGIADIPKYKKNVNVCLGTDGQGSGNNMNLFYHMSLTDLLQKGYHKDATIMSSYDILQMATINGAKALGLEKEIGSIEEGKNADIIIINKKDIETYPQIDLITNLVHSTDRNDIDTTIINGEILMENHQLKNSINIEQLKKHIERIIKRVIV